MKILKVKITALLSFALMTAASPCMAADNLISKADLRIAAQLGKKAYGSDLAYKIDESLTTEVGPRRVGTYGDSAGIAWAVAKMKAFGFNKVWTERVVTPGWYRGKIEARVTAPYPQRIEAIALGNSVGTGKEGVTAPLVHFRTMAELKAVPDGSLKGKIAFISLRMERAHDASGYGKGGAPRRKGGIIAGKKGALALIIRSVGTSNNRITHTGGQSGNIPAAAISNPDADLLVNMFKRTKEIKFFLKSTAGRTKDVITANVIGEITGSSDPKNYVVMGAHLDSWDMGTGAIDDGMGVGIVLAAAKNIIDSGKRPKRSIRVLLFGAEEIGLYGAAAYVKKHEAEMARHVIGAEWDLGTGKIYSLQPGVGQTALKAIAQMAKL